MQTTEHLREILAAQQKETARLMARADEADLLLGAMQELSAMGLRDDPFPVVFSALGKILQFDICLALTKHDRKLTCTGATDPAFVGRVFDVGRLESKSLRGKPLAILPGSKSTLDETGGRCAIYLPLSAAGSCGVLAVMRAPEKGTFSRKDLALAARFAILASQAVSLRTQAEAENRNRYLTALSKSLEQQAHFDHLTGLPNRVKVDMILDDLTNREPRKPFALAFVDVNKFKQINDYYGHDLGDVLLRKLAERISRLMRAGDTLARISGDEFLIVLDGVADQATADVLLGRVLQATHAPFRIGAYTVHSSISVGVARFPEHSLDKVELRRHADSAMFRAKMNPGGSVVHFDNSMAQDLTAKMEIESRLRRAIETCGFTPVFQPQVDIRQKCVVGLEVLLRWQDDEGRLHAPDAFIHIAEELGLINQITEITARKVAYAMPEISACFGRDVSVSLNIAAGQATNLSFLKRLIDILRPETYPDKIVFEITEDQELDVETFMRHVRPLLERHNVQLAIDDFGKGYSSLAALSQIDAHEVKVDRDFVASIHLDPAKQRVLQMIEYYATASGMKCVVEGAETEEEIAYLLEHTNTSIVQGYFFARPMELEKLLSWTPDFVVRLTA